MTRDQLTAIVRGLVPTVREYVAGATDALSARIKAIEEREPIAGPEGQPGQPGAKGEQGEKGDPGPAGEFPLEVVKQIAEKFSALEASVEDIRKAAYKTITELKTELVTVKAALADAGKEGRGVTPDELKALVVAHVDARVAQIPVPNDGTSVTAEDVAPLIADLVDKKFQALPKPEHGKDGQPGQAGKDGSSVTAEDVAPLIAAEVEKAVKALPVPQNGKPGQDGVGIKSALIDQDGGLVLTMTDGTVEKPGKVVGHAGPQGEKGQDGRDGVDGVGFDDVDEALEDDGRTLVRTYRKDDRVKVFRHRNYRFYDRGVFADGKSYYAGDGVTWGGSFWIAQDDTTAKPGLNTPESRAWRLAVKAGRDGKPGAEGKPGPAGPPGLKGDPGRNGY